MAIAVLILLLSVNGAVHAATPKIDPAACRNLVNNTPSPDVAYKPGVDVDGNYVAPADLPGTSSIQMPKKINIPLTISLAQALHFDTTQYPYNQLGTGTETTLGTLTVEGNNVTMNGKPLSDDQQSDLATLCAQQK